MSLVFLHPSTEQLFVVHMHSKHTAGGRWCWNINTRRANSSVTYHFSILQKEDFFWVSFLLYSGEHNIIEAGRKALLLQVSQHQRMQERSEPKTGNRGFWLKLPGIPEPHHYQLAWGVSHLHEDSHQTISDQSSCYLPPKRFTKPITLT